MAERTQIVVAEPAIAAQLFGRFFPDRGHALVPPALTAVSAWIGRVG
jgi:hypothetical protein